MDDVRARPRSGATAAAALDIRLAIDPARARQWHRGLASELRRRGHRVSIELRPGGPRPPMAIGLIMAIERLAHKQPEVTPGADWPSDQLMAEARPAGESSDLEIDLTGQRQTEPSKRVLRPVYGQALVEEAAVSDLLAGRIPEIGFPTAAHHNIP